MLNTHQLTCIPGSRHAHASPHLQVQFLWHNSHHIEEVFIIDKLFYDPSLHRNVYGVRVRDALLTSGTHDCVTICPKTECINKLHKQTMQPSFTNSTRTHVTFLALCRYKYSSLQHVHA